jgi:gamma-glutamyltranspeptidase/glutathione hydrolase
VLHLADGRELAFDFREVAPGRASRDMFLVDGVLDSKRTTDGALAVAVPGAVRGYLELHAKHGRLARATVLGPAIKAAEQGFVVTPKYMALARRREACLRTDAEAARIFLRPGADGVPAAPALGTRLTQPELAATLHLLSAKGAAGFYAGKVAKAVVASVQGAGGLLTLDDLTSYTTHWRAPLEGSYRGHRFITMPLPSAGGLAIVQTLGMLENRGAKGPAMREVASLHTFIEALRLAYVERAKYLGDPAFVEVPVATLTSSDYLAGLASHINPLQATKSSALLPAQLRAPPPAPDAGTRPDKNTTHISVIDGAGNAVALTTTVNYSFGSCLVAKGTGVLLNDQMDDFAAQPGAPNAYGLVTGEANAVQPGKIPLSSMSPTLVFMKGRPHEVLLAVGSPGGSTIPTTVMQVMSAVIDADLDVARAVGLGRLHHQWLPDTVWFDKAALEPATKAGLEALGHKLEYHDAWGDAEAVMVDPLTSLRTAASDPRNEGAPAGIDGPVK